MSSSVSLRFLADSVPLRGSQLAHLPGERRALPLKLATTWHRVVWVVPLDVSPAGSSAGTPMAPGTSDACGVHGRCALWLVVGRSGVVDVVG